MELVGDSFFFMVDVSMECGVDSVVELLRANGRVNSELRGSLRVEC